jgi:hypothetical protein
MKHGIISVATLVMMALSGDVKRSKGLCGCPKRRLRHYINDDATVTVRGCLNRQTVVGNRLSAGGVFLRRPFDNYLLS